MREMNGGRLTRPRNQWRGKQRGRGRTSLAADQQQLLVQQAKSFTAMMAQLLARKTGDR
jgi:hypothetical protein